MWRPFIHYAPPPLAFGRGHVGAAQTGRRVVATYGAEKEGGAKNAAW
jgi:hypothetical protein